MHSERFKKRVQGEKGGNFLGWQHQSATLDVTQPHVAASHWELFEYVTPWSEKKSEFQKFHTKFYVLTGENFWLGSH